MTSRRDYYEILGVSRDADAAELKSAYRKLALHVPPRPQPEQSRTPPRSSRRPPRPTPSSPTPRSAPATTGSATRRPEAGGGFGGFPGFDPSGFGDLSDLFGGPLRFRRGGAVGPARREATSSTGWRSRSATRRSASRRRSPSRASRLRRLRGLRAAEPGTAPRTCPTCRGAGASALAGIPDGDAAVPGVPGRGTHHRSALPDVLAARVAAAPRRS